MIGTKTFDVSEYDNIFAIRLEWAEGKAPSIYEIYTNEDEKQNTDDIGIYVEQIIDTEADSENQSLNNLKSRIQKILL